MTHITSDPEYTALVCEKSESCEVTEIHKTNILCPLQNLHKTQINLKRLIVSAIPIQHKPLKSTVCLLLLTSHLSDVCSIYIHLNRRYMSHVYYTPFNALPKDAIACYYYPIVYELFKNAFNCSYYTVFNDGQLQNKK